MRALFLVLFFLCGCKAGSTCQGDKSCAAGLFCIHDKCASPSCTDNVRDGDETDIDCGGSCPGCGAALACAVGSDCASHTCTAGVCGGTSCTDGVKNGSETDVDCGGSACPKCADLKACVVAADCANGLCHSSICISATCTDGTKNGAETDVDCGGGNCPKCGPLQACAAPSDCQNGICANGLCGAASCVDHVKNGTETDVDCGGSCATGCDVGKACAVNQDCALGFCENLLCVACQKDNDCFVEGKSTQCVAFACNANVCVPTAKTPVQTPNDCATLSCDATYHLVSTATPSDVDADQPYDCHKYDCENCSATSCTRTFVPVPSDLTPQTAGDCHKYVCTSDYSSEIDSVDTADFLNDGVHNCADNACTSEGALTQVYNSGDAPPAPDICSRNTCTGVGTWSKTTQNNQAACGSSPDVCDGGNCCSDPIPACAGTCQIIVDSCGRHDVCSGPCTNCAAQGASSSCESGACRGPCTSANCSGNCTTGGKVSVSGTLSCSGGGCLCECIASH